MTMQSMPTWAKTYTVFEMLKTCLLVLRVLYKPILFSGMFLLIPALLLISMSTGQMIASYISIVSQSLGGCDSIIGDTGYFFWFLVTVILLIIFHVMIQTLVISTIHNSRDAKIPNQQDALAFLRFDRLKKPLLTYSVFFFILFPSILFGIILSSNAAGLANVLFVVIMTLIILMYIRWNFIFQAVIVHQKNSYQAMSFSAQLVRNQWTRVFGYLIVFNLVIFGISQLLLLPFKMILDTDTITQQLFLSFQSVLPENPAESLASVQDSFNGLSASGWRIGFIFTLSVWIMSVCNAIYTTLLYYDLGIKKSNAFPQTDDTQPLP